MTAQQTDRPSMEPSDPSPVLLILSKGDERLVMVDPKTLQVIAKLPAGGNPHEVLASADGRTAWISNYGNGSLHTITVVDLVRRQRLATLDLGALWGPHGLALAGGQVWFTAEREKLVARFAAGMERQPCEGNACGLRSLDLLLGTGQTGTHMLWVSQDQQQVVTANVGAGTLSLMRRNAPGPLQPQGGPPSKAGATTTHGSDPQPVPDWLVTTVKVGGLPEGFDVLLGPDGSAQTVWAANAREGTVSVVDVPSGSVTNTLDLGVVTANRLRFTPDGRLALISREKSGDLTVVDVRTEQVVKHIAIGTGAAGVLIEPGGERAYVSCSPDNKVVVLDLHSLQITGSILPGKEPDGLAWAAGIR